MARNGTMPLEAYTGDKVRVLSTKAPPELIRQVRELAVVRDCTASVIVKKAVEQYLKDNH